MNNNSSRKYGVESKSFYCCLRPAFKHSLWTLVSAAQVKKSQMEEQNNREAKKESSNRKNNFKEKAQKSESMKKIK